MRQRTRVDQLRRVGTLVWMDAPAAMTAVRSAVEALMTRNGLTASGGTAYNLALADDWNSVVGNTNIAVATVAVSVANVANGAPQISGAGPSATTDNAGAAP